MARLVHSSKGQDVEQTWLRLLCGCEMLLRKCRIAGRYCKVGLENLGVKASSVVELVNQCTWRMMQRKE